MTEYHCKYCELMLTKLELAAMHVDMRAMRARMEVAEKRIAILLEELDDVVDGVLDHEATAQQATQN